MVSRTLRMALLVGAVTAAVVSPARAYHLAPCCYDSCGAPPACAPAQAAPCAPAAAPAAPQYRTITVTECVPETYTVKRTCYKYECRTEMVNSFKCVSVPECRERVCTVVKKVPCVKTEMRKVCKTVTCYENRTVMKNCYQTVQETVCKKHCVRLGHWECKEVCSHGLFSGGGHGNCCDPCANSCCQTKTRRVWVHCPEYEERPHTVCKRVCVQVPTTTCVKVCKQVWSEVPVQVCSYTCVTEQVTQKYTCMVTKQVPCQVCRTVRVCVPYETTVTCCRMVQRQKCIQVPVTTCCSSPCESSCGHGRRGLFRRHHGCCE